MLVLGMVEVVAEEGVVNSLVVQGRDAMQNVY